MRIAQVAKMGYVPTPLSQVAKIKRFLKFPEEGVLRLLDPCAGEGAALAALASGHANAITYGVELDGARAEEAAKVLHHAKHCAIERARIEKKAFSLLFLNPPYDQAAKGSEEIGGIRKELLFLRNTSKYLMPEGTLVFIIPRRQITRELAQAVVGRYREVTVYRFDDETYGDYHQVVLFGIRRQGAIGAGTEEDKKRYRSLVAIGEAENEDTLPTLDEMGPVYCLPPASETEPLFRAATTDMAELVEDIHQSPVFESIEGVLGTENSDIKMANPLLPFRRTHMATLIAAGALNGAVGQGANRHLVVGVSKKMTTASLDKEENKETFKETYKSVVRLFLADGTIRDLE